MTLIPVEKINLSLLECSPQVKGRTRAFLTLDSFDKGGDGGGPLESDDLYHSDGAPLVAQSTRWIKNKRRCFNNVYIYGNGRSVKAMVVVEDCSDMGCVSHQCF
ncbi:unnamed protein product [Fraxinus pennsylvanica]|uniref:Uncharacterized protein n=1 Tax=Fraxinus pennsylvanica TaxID=56036 RepID=A0AAD2DSA3_9LAMI|nr:unnamed protein product [Fraxinus pennsylvanica]